MIHDLLPVIAGMFAFVCVWLLGDYVIANTTIIKRGGITWLRFHKYSVSFCKRVL